MDNLENIIESLLFLSGNAIEIKDITEKLQISKEETKQAINSLKEKYKAPCGIHMLCFNNKIQFSSNPAYAAMVEGVLNPIKERELSKAMMEVASIVAYKQPVTRLEVEEIRGVNSDYALMVLSKHNIIEVVGRKDTIGKPILYGTTDEFLKRFGLSSLNELPDYNDVLSRIKILHPDISSDLYYREQCDENKDKAVNPDKQQDVKDTQEKQDVLFNKEELPDFLKNEQNLKIIGE